jgi:hypothetical protein
MEANIGRIGLRPRDESFYKIICIERAAIQKAERQRERHLSIIGEAARREPACCHFGDKLIGGALGAELKRHSKCIPYGCTDGNSAQPILEKLIDNNATVHPVNMPFAQPCIIR